MNTGNKSEVVNPNPEADLLLPDTDGRLGLYSEIASCLSQISEVYSEPLAQQIDKFARENPDTTPLTIEGKIRFWCSRYGRALSTVESAEQLAFILSPRSPHNRESQIHGQTYFDVRDGNDVTLEYIAYWKDRARSALHPSLMARYSDLVWDLESQLPGLRKTPEFGRRAVDGYLSIALRSTAEYKMNAWSGLLRALAISELMKDRDRSNSVIDAMLRYESKHAKDDLPGTWGNAFSSLILEKRAKIDNELKQAILHDVIDRYRRVLGSPCINENSVRCGFEVLRGYYLRFVDKVPDWICTGYADWMTEKAERDENPLIRQHTLLCAFYALREAKKHAVAERFLLEAEETGIDVVKSLKKSSYTIEISAEEVRQWIEQFFQTHQEDALSGIAVRFVLREELLRASVEKATKDRVWYYISPPVEIDGFGRPMNTVNTSEDSDDMLYHAGKHDVLLHFQSCLLLLREFVSRSDDPTSDIIRHCFQSPVFDESHQAVLERAVRAHVEEDFIASIGLLVPEIEHLLRRLTRLVGIPSWEPKDNAFYVKTLGILLNDNRVTEVLGPLAFELRFLFIDNRGLNIRNDYCHGLMTQEGFNEVVSVMLMHVVLYFGLFREETSE